MKSSAPKVRHSQVVKESSKTDRVYDVSTLLTDLYNKKTSRFLLSSALTMCLLTAIPVLHAFSGPDIAAEAGNRNAVSRGDVDGDNDLDLIVGYRHRPNRLYLNDGLGNYDAGRDISAGAFDTLAIALGDVDGDGDLDLVTGNASNCNRLYRNDGIGNFTAGEDILTDHADTYDIELGDVDGDGDLDLVVGNLSQASSLYLNDGTGSFGSGSLIAEKTSGTLDITLGDADGDGDLDLVLQDLEDGLLHKLHLNDGSGQYGAAIQVHAVSVSPADYNEGIRTAATGFPSSVTILVPLAGP